MRANAIALREAIPEAKRNYYTKRIREKTIAYLASISAKFVHIYIGFKSEVGTLGIIEDLLESNLKVAVPVIAGEGKDLHMVHARLDNLANVRTGKFGIPEPTVVHEISIEDLDAVIVPMVAFDARGMRLGYGKGFYDRFLATLSPKTVRIGLAFSQQEMDRIPMLSHDELINNILTEQSHFFFK
ncbi:MAG: 5-formyltetrahydrofolate cyclo-ligase [Bacteroidota bacterium]|nr:5-formyltetrahydrofolate cyclo-ligase [Bacteroidota bacterium]MDP4229125.1 5-formyltetrahydrofolate cyclo-ligase [Bacteroidota bacterium]MDP4235607.1 5-formyltetrahydrofolate cyclo-ligase [Bacteroidota bacterium]